jgi:hypothetical protein
MIHSIPARCACDAINPPGPIAEDFDRVMTVNAKIPLPAMRGAARVMRDRWTSWPAPRRRRPPTRGSVSG